MTPRPIQRIDEIIKFARQYMTEVVRANVPIQYVSGAEFEPKMIEPLRSHREANQRPDSELMILKEKLSKLNCDFVLDGEIAWSLDVLDWETKIWGPLQRWVQRGHAILFERRPGAIWPVRVPEQSLRKWLQQGQEIERLLADRKVTFCPDDVLPIISKNERSYRWRGVDYSIPGKNQFDLFVLLVTNAGRNVSYQVIAHKLCSLSGMSNDAIHQTVCRLRQSVPPDLRNCIHNGQQNVRLDIPQPAWCS